VPKRGNQNEQIQGVVEHLNFSKSGDPNGAVLDTGHFVHMKRRAARALNLRIGQTLKVQGKSKTSASGQQVIEAAAVNGIDLGSVRASKKAAPSKDASSPVAAKRMPAKKALSKSSRKKTSGASTT
jgi:hypothetical protein